MATPLQEQADRAIHAYEAAKSAGDVDGEFTTPDPLAYAFGWMIASAIVGARYHDSAIDVLPVNDPQHGWDRFLVTRRVSCQHLGAEAANAFGMILLAGEGAPHIAHPDGSIRSSLGKLLRSDTDAAIAEALACFPPVGLVAGDHTRCPHAEASAYPKLYDAIAGCILDHPGVVAARELVIDDQAINGVFHPLFIHTGGRARGINYDWFAVEHGDYVAFARITGRQSVHRTDKRTWAAQATPLAGSDVAEIRRHLLSWLRLERHNTRAASGNEKPGDESPG